MENQDDFCGFYHHICHFCKSSPGEPPEKFKKCSNCKLFAYCSVEHQKADWKRHKPFCRAVKEITGGMQTDSLFTDEECDSNFHYRCQCLFIKLAENFLKRNLTGDERFSIQFADLCGKCYRPNVDRIPCLNCSIEYYCSELHREEHAHVHAKDCGNLILCFALDNWTRLKKSDPTRLIIDYVSRDRPFPVNMIEFLKECGSKMNEMDKIIMSCLLSYSLTLVYALKLAKSACLKKKERLTIHVLGAEKLESLLVNVMDSLFYWNTNLKSISLNLIGPNAPHTVEPVSFQTKQVEVTCWSGLYHDFVGTSSYTKPDVAVAFNCGFHEFQRRKDTWQDTIVQLTGLESGSLVVFTSYTKKESDEDFAAVKYLDIQGRLDLLRCSANPYASLRPFRNPERDDEDTSIFFYNNYLTVFEIK